MMNQFTQWLENNPSSFVSLMTAMIAASVALIVLALTHYFTRRRESTRCLTGKLEELYLSLNQVAENNVHFFKLIALCLDGYQNARDQLNATDEAEIYGRRLAKRIIMLIRLYFPHLSGIHQKLFAAQRQLNELIYQLHSESPPELDRVIDASGRVGHFVRLMEQELILNRDHLLRNCLWYK